MKLLTMLLMLGMCTSCANIKNAIRNKHRKMISEEAHSVWLLKNDPTGNCQQLGLVYASRKLSWFPPPLYEMLKQETVNLGGNRVVILQENNNEVNGLAYICN